MQPAQMSLLIILYFFFWSCVCQCGEEPCGFHRCETDAHQGRKVRRGGALVFGLVVVTLGICSFQTSLEMRDVLLLTPPLPPCWLRLSNVSHPASAICEFWLWSPIRGPHGLPQTEEVKPRAGGVAVALRSANHLSPPLACALLVCTPRWSIGRPCPPAGCGSGCTFFIRILSFKLSDPGLIGHAGLWHPADMAEPAQVVLGNSGLHTDAVGPVDYFSIATRPHCRLKTSEVEGLKNAQVTGVVKSLYSGGPFISAT